MPTSLFKQHIQELNFSFISNKDTSGVLFTENYENIEKEISSPNILFALETAYKFEADAVYFRYFQDGRSIVPQLYIFDFTNKILRSEDRNRIHRNMWNGYQVPAYIIIEDSIVSVFDAREKPKKDKEHYAEEIIIKTGNAIKSFNAQSFDDGLFWEKDVNKKRFQFEQSATRDLIRGLKNVYYGFQKESNLDKHVALKLLVQSLLIKYLEERDEDSKSGYFAGTYFKKNFQCTNFCEVIRKGKLLFLLDKLAEDFNGKIFEWHKEYEKAEREAINKSHVRKLADYLDANNKDGQFVIWNLYSFKHLPVEVISSVYEELLTDSKDIVYTPEMIVSTLVDECMPLKIPKKDFKLIDISCGSGIFLVKAYKRIVQWWRYEQWQKTGKLEKPSLYTLKNLLLKNIYGVDIQQDAIRLSIFSLSLAMLDEVNLDPPTWEELKFPDMSNNIVTKDFFKFIMGDHPDNFSMVIGNPPFNPPKTHDGKKPSNSNYIKSMKEKYGYTSEIHIPTQNIALHFLVQSFKLLKEGGLLCLIQPSGPILYQDEQEFKKNFFSKINLLQVIDFSKLSDCLWGKAKIATVAFFAQNSLPDEELVLHLIAERTFSNKNRLFLEFDYYNFHFVSKSRIFDKPFIWKSNLLGGGRLFKLIDKLDRLPKLNSYLSGKRKNNKWAFGVGFIVGNKRKKADYITGKKYVEVSYLTEKGLREPETCDIEGFDNPRNKYIYKAPNILIRGVIGNLNIPIFFSEEDVSFPKGIIGIHAPKSEYSELIKMYDYLTKYSELLRVFIMSTSGRVLVDKATALNKEDIFNIPFIETPIIVSEVEQLIINDVQRYYSKVKSDDWLRNVTPTVIKRFIEVFCKTLNSVYQNKNKSFHTHKIIDAGNYLAIHFEYGCNDDLIHEVQTANLEEYLQAIIPTRNNNQTKIHLQKIMKLYGKDSLVLIKPKQTRYWLPSIALRDADEVFADYIKTRYQDAKR